MMLVSYVDILCIMAYVQRIIGPFTSLLLNSKSMKGFVIIGQLSLSFSQLPGTYAHAQGDLFFQIA